MAGKLPTDEYLALGGQLSKAMIKGPPALLHRALGVFAESRIPKVSSERDTQETS